MNCQEARTLIDDRVHGSLPAELAVRLDEHLKDCGDCRGDLRQLLKVRDLLRLTRNDAPSKQLLQDMFGNIRRSIQSPAAPSAPSTPATHERTTPMSAATVTAPSDSTALPRHKMSASRWKLVAAASLSAAALLLVSFMLGTDKYGRSGQDRSRSQAVSYAPGPKGSESAQTHSAPAPGYFDNSNSMDWTRSHTESRTPMSKPMFESGMSSSSGSSGGSGGEMDDVNRPARDPREGGRNFDGKSAEVWQNNQKLAPPEAPRLSKPGLTTSQEASPTDSSKDPASKGFAGEGEKKDGPAAENAPAAASKPKIIKTGDLTVEVKNFTEASRAADALVIKYQGFVADSRTIDLPGATKRGEIVIRVSPDHFEEIFSDLKKLGVVLTERAGGQDITSQYTDTQARIKNMQIEEERLQDLIKSKSFIDKIQSLLEVERELARVRGEIESMQGQMRVWDNQLSLSSIRVTLTEPTRSVPSGSISVEIASLTDAKARLDAAVSNAGGQILNGQTSKRSDGTLMGTYTIRVKFARFADVLGAIKGLGRINDEQLHNQPLGGVVPEGAGDVACDIALTLFERSISLPSGQLNVEVMAIPDALTKLYVGSPGTELEFAL